MPSVVIFPQSYDSLFSFRPTFLTISHQITKCFNLQEDKTLQWDRMYGDWSSFCYAFQSNQLPNKSVLTTLPMSPDGAKQIVTLVVQPIAANIGITLPAPLSKLNTDKEVNWCMEVGISFFSELLQLKENNTTSWNVLIARWFVMGWVYLWMIMMPYGIAFTSTVSGFRPCCPTQR